MPANKRPIYPLTPVVAMASIIAVLTARTTISGTTGLTAVTQTSTNGLKVDEVVIQLQETAAAAIVLLFIYDGTNSILFDEIAYGAVTPSTTTSAVRVSKTYDKLVLPPTYRLYAATTIDQDTNVIALCGAY